ncbi:hypothetical protein ACFS3C_05890 [Azotobacter vinelandii]
MPHLEVANVDIARMSQFAKLFSGLCDQLFGAFQADEAVDVLSRLSDVFLSTPGLGCLASFHT